jgi:hypothetical protein
VAQVLVGLAPLTARGQQAGDGLVQVDETVRVVGGVHRIVLVAGLVVTVVMGFEVLAGDRHRGLAALAVSPGRVQYLHRAHLLRRTFRRRDEEP